MKVAENGVLINFITESKEHLRGVSNRYGYHKHMIRKADIREKLFKFLSPREFYYLRMN